MTKTARNSAALGILLLGLLGAIFVPKRAAAQENTLFAYGASALAGESASSANPVWLASTETRSGSEATWIYLREKVGDSTWLELPYIKGKILGITGQQGELVVLVKRASPNAWLWMSTIAAGAGVRSSYGPALPDRMEFVTLAGDRRTLWAIGRAPMPQASTTTRAAATTAPAASAVQRWQLKLFQLSGETWTPQNAEWPADAMPAATEDISMCIVNDRPTVAAPLGESVVQVLQFQNGNWAAIQRRTTGPKARRIKLLSLQDRPVVWIQPEGPKDVGGRVWTGAEHEFTLSIPDPQPKPENVTVTVAGDNVIRLFWRATADKKESIYELRFDAEGGPNGKNPVEVIASRPRDSQMQWAMVVVAAIAAILVLNFILRRRAAMRNANQEDEDRPDPDE